MEMTEKGYNMKLLQPFLQIDNVIGVSGRCCVNISQSLGVGKMGYDILKPISDTIDKNLFYIYDTCNRGPLLFDRKKIEELGYLDEKHYFLDNSDHDLFARAYHFKQWICGYIPIEFVSPIENGSTRKQRDMVNEKWFQHKKKTCNGNGFLKEYFPNAPIRDLITVRMNYTI
jgi:hypothetical protein